MSDYSDMIRLADVVKQLRAPDGCPWDREQTHHSIKRNLVEETGEFLDALEEGDTEGVREELGDLLLQVVLHAQIGAEEGEYDLWGIAAEEADKLIRRHPHVFGEKKAADAAEAIKVWDGAKVGEAGAQSKRKSVMDGVPRSMPGLSRSQKALTKAAKCGFEWPSRSGALSKVEEELDEVREAAAEGNREHLAEELGDLLCAVTNLCRINGFEAEELLHASTGKFIRRFKYIEEKTGTPLPETSLDRMQELWKEAKKEGL